MKNSFKSKKVNLHDRKKIIILQVIVVGHVLVATTTKVGLCKIQYCRSFFHFPKQKIFFPGNPSDRIIPHSKMAPSRKGFASNDVIKYILSPPV